MPAAAKLLDDGEHRYIYGLGAAPLAQVDNTGTVDYLHSDLTGSVRTTTDAAGDITGDTDYDPYGRPRTATAGGPTANVTRFGYAGEYTDSTGYLYLRNRYYDPASAQFLTVDPLLQTTQDPYGYTAGNPLQFTDPLGLDWIQDAGDWSSAFGDTVTFGGTKEIRRLLGVDGSVNYCSTFHSYGQVGGVFGSMGTLFATGTVAVVYAGVAGTKGAMDSYSYSQQGDPWMAAVSAATALPGLGLAASQGGRFLATTSSLKMGQPLVRSGSWWSELNKWSDLSVTAATFGTAPLLVHTYAQTAP